MNSTPDLTLSQNFPPASRRKGHKYARSSVHHVAHNIPTSSEPLTPLQVPASLPIPTAKELRSSMTTFQLARFAWTFAHIGIAAFIQFRAHGTLSVTTLAHLVFLDALGGLVRGAVDVAKNFEVWGRSSVRTPFGLQRAEALARGAGSVVLLFMGVDLISHGLQDALSDSLGGHAHAHGGAEEHHEIGMSNAGIPALLGLSATLISVTLLRAGGGQQLNYYLPGSLASILLLIAVSGSEAPVFVDVLISSLYAIAMVIIGFLLCYRVGRMLLMSYDGPSVAVVVDELRKDPQVVSVEEAKVWQVHYGLCMATFKVRTKSLDQVERLRERISTLVRMRLGGGYGDGAGVTWEISSQISLESS
jgi:hypothetical protein